MNETHYTLEYLDQTATPCTRCGVEIRFCLAGFRDGQPLCHRCFRLERTDLAPILGLIATVLVRGVDLLVPGEDCAMAEEEILTDIRQTLLLRRIARAHDLEALGWVYLADSRRVAGQHFEAKAGFKAARQARR